MAKRKGSKKRSSRRGGGGGGFSRSIDGIIAGAGGTLVAKFLNLGAYTQPITDIVTGHYRNNEALQTIGGRQIGSIIAQGINMPFTTYGGGALTGSGSLVG